MSTSFPPPPPLCRCKSVDLEPIFLHHELYAYISALEGTLDHGLEKVHKLGKRIEDKRNQLGDALGAVDELEEELEDREDEWQRRYERMERRHNARDEGWRLCVRFMDEIGLMRTACR